MNPNIPIINPTVVSRMIIPNKDGSTDIWIDTKADNLPNPVTTHLWYRGITDAKKTEREVHPAGDEHRINFMG
jgi:hypothetical protein